MSESKPQLPLITQNAAEFRACLPEAGRLLALDLGEKTIGLALSDALRLVATPLHTICRGKFSRDAEALIGLVKEQEISGLVMGYPVNMDGTPGPRCQATATYARNLSKLLPLPILLADERLTTVAVTRTMLDADLSRKRRAELVDKLAAGYLLQTVLDGMV